MDVVANLVDDIRLCDGRYNAQAAATLGTQLDIDFEGPLQAFSPGKRGERVIGIGWNIGSTRIYLAK